MAFQRIAPAALQENNMLQPILYIVLMLKNLSIIMIIKNTDTLDTYVYCIVTSTVIL